jgi:hypothetical protein
MDRETQQIMIVKQGLVQMCGTMGWEYFKGMAKNVVELAIQAALDEEDPVRAESKRLKAKAMQSGLADLFSTVEAAKQFEPQALDDNGGFDLDPFVVQQVIGLEI